MQTYNIHENTIISNLDQRFPSTAIIPNKETIQIPKNTTAFGFITEDNASIKVNHQHFDLYEGMYFSLPGDACITNMTGFLCLRENYQGLFNLGGPTEKIGRMRYIDGCSDTLLLSPLMLGEPCFNYLYVPNNINQTPHTHPSVRVGCIVEGAGYCRSETGKFDLLPGRVFVLPPDEIHSFHTEDSFLRIAVFHPDSDFGPTHEAHPMINRTYIEGVSLQGDNAYRTRSIYE